MWFSCVFMVVFVVLSLFYLCFFKIHLGNFLFLGYNHDKSFTAFYILQQIIQPKYTLFYFSCHIIQFSLLFLVLRSSNDSQAHFKFLLRKRSLLTLESLFLRSKTASVLLLSEQ